LKKAAPKTSAISKRTFETAGAFDNPVLEPMEDRARLDLAMLSARGERLAFTTDSYVVDPIFFQAAISGSLRFAVRSMT
jgi:hydrogenase maturation factor